MTYEARANGTHALTCDTGVCSHELLAPNEAELSADATACGWVEQSGKHICSDCARGAWRMKSVLKALFGTEDPQVAAPANVRKGDPVFAPDGTQIAIYTNDAQIGQVVGIEPFIPVAVRMTVSDKYAQILGIDPGQGNPPGSVCMGPDPEGDGEEDDVFDAFNDIAAKDEQCQEAKTGEPTLDDLFGEPIQLDMFDTPVQPKAHQQSQARVNHRARPDGAARAAQGRAGTANRLPPGTEGGLGMFKNPEHQTPVAERVKPARPKVKIEYVDDGVDPFKFLDIEKTRWNPDGT